MDRPMRIVDITKEPNKRDRIRAIIFIDDLPHHTEMTRTPIPKLFKKTLKKNYKKIYPRHMRDLVHD